MAFTLMDGRYMANVEDIEGALEAIKALKAVKYTEMGVGGGTKYGLVGDTVAKAAPCAGEIDGVGMARVDLVALIPVLVAAIQELSSKSRTRTVVKKAAE